MACVAPLSDYESLTLSNSDTLVYLVILIMLEVKLHCSVALLYCTHDWFFEGSEKSTADYDTISTFCGYRMTTCHISFGLRHYKRYETNCSKLSERILNQTVANFLMMLVADT